MAHEGRSNLRTWGSALLKLVLLVLVLRWGVVEVFTIHSTSMEPSLHGGEGFFEHDRIAVNKLAYGPRVPFAKQRIFKTGSPRRWDIVVFEPVRENSEYRRIVKRVIALPGETVTVGPHGVRVNGKFIEPPEHLKNAIEHTLTLVATDDTAIDHLLLFAVRGELPQDFDHFPEEQMVILRKDFETLKDRVRGLDLDSMRMSEKRKLAADVHPTSIAVVRFWWTRTRRLMTPSWYGVVAEPVYTHVREGHYFVLGDNGAQSVDSRHYGWVPEENIIGRAYAIILPFGRIRDLDGFTRTASGRTILIGFVMLVVLWDLIPRYVLSSQRVKPGEAPPGLDDSDRVLVDRLVYGIRLPFAGIRVFVRRDPQPGEYVAVSLPGKGLRVAHVLRKVETGVPPACYLAEIGSAGGAVEVEISTQELIGNVVSVWWPLRRRRRVRSDGSTNDTRDRARNI